MQFLVFLPVVVSLYYLLPQKVKHYWLLVASYFFYMCWNAKYVVLILFTTVVTYTAGICLERVGVGQENLEQRKVRRKKLYLTVGIVLNLFVLFLFKYLNFGIETLSNLWEQFHISLHVPTFDILLPVGISFYTFQALGYMIDVYRGEIYAEKNFFRYALFISFFPQLVAGPIERSRNLLRQLSALPNRISFAQWKEGTFLILWGYFLKVVLADRIAIFVDTVYGDIDTYTGCFLLVATLLFAVQIYCDFAGYSIIAMGTAKLLGIQLMENFNAPYFAMSVSEFWRRWHISLSGWFRDYLYIPLGGNRRGKGRKYLNILITFGVSGLWHGADFSYVVWGLLNGAYQVIGDLLMPVRQWTARILEIRTQSLSHKLLKVLTTFLMVDFAWIFFRASSIREALRILWRIVTVHNAWVLIDGSLYTCGLERKNFHLMILGIVLMMCVDWYKRQGIKIREVLARQDYWAQCLVVSAAVVGILLFGIWGVEYDASNFIYFQF